MIGELKFLWKIQKRNWGGGDRGKRGGSGQMLTEN